MKKPRPAPPTFLSVGADIAAGMSEADAVKKAARQLADWIDDQVYRDVMATLEADERARNRPAWTMPSPRQPLE